MKIGIALTLVIACPSVAAAQYGFQLRPSPYRILSGWEQSANIARSQTIGHASRAATSADRTQTDQAGILHNGRDGDLTGSVYRTQSTH